MNDEIYTADENLMKFFTRLITLKMFIKSVLESAKEEETKNILSEIDKELESLIKVQL